MDALGIAVDPRQRAKSKPAVASGPKPTEEEAAVDLSTLKTDQQPEEAAEALVAPPAAPSGSGEEEKEEAAASAAAPAHMASVVPELAPEAEAAVDLSSPPGVEAEPKAEKAPAQSFEVAVNGDKGSPPPAHMDHGGDDSRVVLRREEKRKVRLF